VCHDIFGEHNVIWFWLFINLNIRIVRTYLATTLTTLLKYIQMDIVVMYIVDILFIVKFSTNVASVCE